MCPTKVMCRHLNFQLNKVFKSKFLHIELHFKVFLVDWNHPWMNVLDDHQSTLYNIEIWNVKQLPFYKFIIVCLAKFLFIFLRPNHVFLFKIEFLDRVKANFQLEFALSSKIRNQNYLTFKILGGRKNYFGNVTHCTKCMPYCWVVTRL